MKPPSLVCGNVFQPDQSLPADHRGLRTCVCGLVGEQGDAHHTPAETAPDAQQRAAGEREEGEG